MTLKLQKWVSTNVTGGCMVTNPPKRGTVPFQREMLQPPKSQEDILS
jgi:hypothetical protein